MSEPPKDSDSHKDKHVFQAIVFTTVLAELLVKKGILQRDDILDELARVIHSLNPEGDHPSLTAELRTIRGTVGTW